MLTRFRAFILWAIDNGYTVNNPFKHFTNGEIVYGTPIYISNEVWMRRKISNSSIIPLAIISVVCLIIATLIRFIVLVSGVDRARRISCL